MTKERLFSTLGGTIERGGISRRDQKLTATGKRPEVQGVFGQGAREIVPTKLIMDSTQGRNSKKDKRRG